MELKVGLEPRMPTYKIGAVATEPLQRFNFQLCFKSVSNIQLSLRRCLQYRQRQ